MLYLFAIFFILELIVAVMLCVGIMVVDKKVCKLAENFKVNRHNLKFKLRAVYDIAYNMKSYISCRKKAFLKRKKEFMRNFIKGILLGIMFFFFKKTKFKKKFLFVEFLLVLYDTFRADCAI